MATMNPTTLMNMMRFLNLVAKVTILHSMGKLLDKLNGNDTASEISALYTSLNVRSVRVNHKTSKTTRKSRSRQTTFTCPIQSLAMSPKAGASIAVGMCPFRPLCALVASVRRVTRAMIDHATIQWSCAASLNAAFNAARAGALLVSVTSRQGA